MKSTMFDVLVLAMLTSCATGCKPTIDEHELGFLDNQKKPLTYSTMVKHLGKAEPGNGPFYQYYVRKEKKSVEFWMNPPPQTEAASAASLPVEIAVVVVSSNNVPRIVWPDDLKGKDVDEILSSLWPPN